MAGGNAGRKTNKETNTVNFTIDSDNNITFYDTDAAAGRCERGRPGLFLAEGTGQDHRVPMRANRSRQSFLAAGA